MMMMSANILMLVYRKVVNDIKQTIIPTTVYCGTHDVTFVTDMTFSRITDCVFNF